MKDTKYIQELLEKFWNTETSTIDESILHNYFASDAIDPSLAYAQAYFKKSQNNVDIASTVVAKLVEKYFNTETSTEEESLIKEYFAQDNISAELKQYKMLFKVIIKAEAVSYPKELVMTMPSRQINEEKTAKVIKFNWWKSAAAASIIAVGGFFVANNLVNKTMPAQQNLTMNKSNVIEPKNAEEAYEITLQALALVSNKYNKGQDQVLQSMRSFNSAADLSN